MPASANYFQKEPGFYDTFQLDRERPTPRKWVESYGPAEHGNGVGTSQPKEAQCVIWRTEDQLKFKEHTWTTQLARREAGTSNRWIVSPFPLSSRSKPLP